MPLTRFQQESLSKNCRVEKVELGTGPTVTLHHRPALATWRKVSKKEPEQLAPYRPMAETESLFDASDRRVDRIHIRSQILTICAFSLKGA